MKNDSVHHYFGHEGVLIFKDKWLNIKRKYYFCLSINRDMELLRLSEVN